MTFNTNNITYSKWIQTSNKFMPKFCNHSGKVIWPRNKYMLGDIVYRFGEHQFSVKVFLTLIAYTELKLIGTIN